MASLAAVPLSHCYLRHLDKRIRSVSAGLLLLVACLILRLQVVLLQGLGRHLHFLIAGFLVLGQERDLLLEAIGSAHELAERFEQFAELGRQVFMFLKIAHPDQDAAVVDHLGMRDGIANELDKMVLEG